MNRRPRELLVFDIGNVLLRFDMDRAARNFEAGERGVGARLKRLLWGSPEGERFETGRLSGPGFHRLLRRRLGLRMGYAGFCRAFNHIFTPVTANLRLLRRLARRRPVALLSNTNPIHWRYIFRAYPALKAARWAYSSHQLGVLKPDPRAYRRLSRRTGVPLDRMVFVDDRPENVRAARRLGMRAHLYDGRPIGRRLESELAAAGTNGHRRA
jgi:FMN phosphatase YigB (HAD superfamily)